LHSTNIFLKLIPELAEEHSNVITLLQGSHSPEKSGKVRDFFWSGKVWEKSENFVGSQGKLAMIIHVAQVLSSVVVAAAFLGL